MRKLHQPHRNEKGGSGAGSRTRMKEMKRWDQRKQNTKDGQLSFRQEEGKTRTNPDFRPQQGRDGSVRGHQFEDRKEELWVWGRVKAGRGSFSCPRPLLAPKSLRSGPPSSPKPKARTVLKLARLRNPGSCVLWHPLEVVTPVVLKGGLTHHPTPSSLEGVMYEDCPILSEPGILTSPV